MENTDNKCFYCGVEEDNLFLFDSLIDSGTKIAICNKCHDFLDGLPPCLYDNEINFDNVEAMRFKLVKELQRNVGLYKKLKTMKDSLKKCSIGWADALKEIFKLEEEISKLKEKIGEAK
jgi:hypothetical protein